jgi:hypothetical protein
VSVFLLTLQLAHFFSIDGTARSRDEQLSELLLGERVSSSFIDPKTPLQVDPVRRLIDASVCWKPNLRRRYASSTLVLNALRSD